MIVDWEAQYLSHVLSPSIEVRTSMLRQCVRDKVIKSRSD